jgi:hypothetical protein
VAEFTPEQLGKYGVLLTDELFHPFDPADASWNESWFWDWFDDEGTRAGHCRIGTFPSQGRLWFWLYLYRDGEWLAIEQPALDNALLQRPRLAFDAHGLRFAWLPRRPLLEGRLEVTGRARVVSGPRAGRMVDVDLTVEVEAAGVPHSTGPGYVEGHESDSFDARRFEQPIDVTVRLTTDAATGSPQVDEYRGRGERDHSWGPRAWNIEWTFFAVSRPALRLQFVEVRIKGFGEPLSIGYLQTPTDAFELVSVSVPVEASDDLAHPFSGRVDIKGEDGSVVAGEIQVISAHEMDISHTLQPPRGTRYHRALVRIVPDDGGDPFIGWLEDNRFFEGDPDRP